jgi:N-acetylneuraminic acid mutarotase
LAKTWDAVPKLALMAALCIALIFCARPPAANAQTAEWVWMSGSDLLMSNGAATGPPGVYGKLGVPGTANVPGGRFGASSWTDGSGNLWLFGGQGVDESQTWGWLNDLWQFSPSTGEWTWMSGSSYIPAGYGWGPPGVYGKLGVAATTNVAGGREGAGRWLDKSGNVWIFGGWGYDSSTFFGQLDDMWEFNPSTREWTWMSGASSIPQTGGGNTWPNGWPGVYGMLGHADAANIPGGRRYPASWTDTKGNFWLFGGDGFDSSGTYGELNDLWMFNPSRREWTWMGGSKAVNQPGTYGNVGVGAIGNIPPARLAGEAWTDASGNFWLFGGATAGFSEYFNDLWKFSPATGEWTWMSGSSAAPIAGSTAGVYGTLGIPAPGNIPGGRAFSSGWADSNGNLWLASGSGLDSKGRQGFLNDLWEFNPSTRLWAWVSGSTTIGSGQSGMYGTLGAPAPGNVPGGRWGSGDWTGHDGSFWLFGGWALDSAGNSGLLNDLWEYQLAAASPAATPVFSLPSKTYNSPQTVTISDATPGATIYYFAARGVATTSSRLYTGPITIDSTTVFNAIAIAPGYSMSADATIGYSIVIPATATPTFSVAPGTYGAAQLLTLQSTTPGAVIHYTTDGSTPTAESQPYTAAIAVTASETVKALAIAPNHNPSALASASYVLAGTPTVLTALATSVGANGATLNALVSSLGVGATYSFQFGTSSTALTSMTQSGSLAATPNEVNVSAAVTGLTAKTTYYFRAVVTTVGGTSTSAIESFTTP